MIEQPEKLMSKSSIIIYLFTSAGGGGVRKVQPRIRGTRIPPQNPQLFDDTSMQQNAYGYTQPGEKTELSVYDNVHNYDLIVRKMSQELIKICARNVE